MFIPTPRSLHPLHPGTISNCLRLAPLIEFIMETPHHRDEDVTLVWGASKWTNISVDAKIDEKSHLRWYGHVMRRDDKHMTKRVTNIRDRNRGIASNTKEETTNNRTVWCRYTRKADPKRIGIIAKKKEERYLIFCDGGETTLEWSLD
ncbi:jg15590 [Pararge aegeria aegeria]|uniref:Jg15590 protein n=1 Tax=Pararge aegeria aegeria TaxID=348720 RepID=A0A8S4RUU0_9NEOP|nr:jg15590 [Pararge aegeria aegeria]